MKKLKALCVYCGSAKGKDPRHAVLARALGNEIAARGISLLYGAGGMGHDNEIFVSQVFKEDGKGGLEVAMGGEARDRGARSPSSLAPVAPPSASAASMGSLLATAFDE